MDIECHFQRLGIKGQVAKPKSDSGSNYMLLSLMQGKDPENPTFPLGTQA